MSTGAAASPANRVAKNSSAAPQGSACNGCKHNLEETNDSVVVAFGDRLWHVNCFRCAKCRNPVEHDSNLLLLSDGSPVCANCSYVCSLCNKLIQHEAIVTGDESYHADCFRCKQCRKRIEELVFAKTSTGLWCLECHHARLARSRKHSEAKRNKLAKQADKLSPPGMSSIKEKQTPKADPVDGLPESPTTPVAASSTQLAANPSVLSVAMSSYSTAASTPPSPLSLAPKLPASSSETGQTTPTLTTSSLLDEPRPSTSNGLPTPPLDTAQNANGLFAPQPAKQSHRRSGFYGMPMPGGLGHPPSSTAPSSTSDLSVTISAAAEEAPSGTVDQTPDAIEMGTVPTVTASAAVESPPLSSSTDISSSMSFYDADMLNNLNNATTRSNTTASAGQTPTEELEQPELLASIELEEAMDSVPARLRESIRQSRSMPAVSSNGGVDVDAVEMLLSELMTTKEKMKELQGKYNEAKRASVQVVEGMAQAREEVEHEAAARREAESEMNRLRQQLREQASRLGQLDVAQQRAEALQRHSVELSTTVVGIERQLASLKAERDISVAEVEQLKRFSGGPAEPLASENIIDSLDSKLAEIKSQHRAELDAILARKEGLAREMDEMRSTRDLYAGEAAALSVTNQELAQQNAALRKQIDEARTALLRIQQSQLALAAINGHTKSPSSSSPTSSARPLLPVVNGRSSPLGPPDLSTDSTSFASVRRVEAAASPAPRKFKWGKSSKTEPLRSVGSNSAVTPQSVKPVRSASIQNGRVESSPMAGHSLQPVSILRPQRCEVCGEKMWGWQERCASCPLVCHSRCAETLVGSCSGVSASASDMAVSRTGLLGRPLIERYAFESAIPRIVTMCIDAVEARGMDYEGIYRKSGGTGQVRLIESVFESDKPIDLCDDERFNDISAVTSALKNYFRSLPDSLFSTALHERFIAAGALRNNDDVQLSMLEETIPKLPPAHLDTLSRLMLHLSRVAQLSEVNKMTPPNLGVVFGPTLLRSGVTDDLEGMKDLQHRNRVVEVCVTHATRLFGAV